MSNQPTISVSITKYEAQAILESHLLNVGLRTLEYADRPSMHFLIDVSLKASKHWKHIVEQFTRIEHLDRADKIAAKFSDKELRKLIA